MSKPGKRLPSETLDMRLAVGAGFHNLSVSLIYEGPELDRLCEIAFVRRGTSGGTLDQMFVELGVMLSRAIQRRDPHTGEAVV